MSSSAEPRPARSIAASIFALVIASVVVATAVFFVVTFSGPPPWDPPRSFRAIAAALRGDASPQGQGQGPAQTLAMRDSATPPVPVEGEMPNPGAQAAVAALLGAAPGDIVALTTDRGPPDGRDEIMGRYTFAWRTTGHWRIVESPERPVFRRWHWITLGAMIAAILALSIPAWTLARAISRPLRQLAGAARMAQAGAPLAALPAGGSREVRALADAVDAMHGRLARHAEGRTAMLAAIAHDLGTPLSRLAFWIEQLPETARARAIADIDEMRAMIAATLAFARDEAGTRGTMRIDLGSLLDSLVEDMAVAGRPVLLSPGPRCVVQGDPAALRRLFANLVENAIRYGDRADVSWRIGEGVAVATVADAGPGIDPTQAESLFEPFVRGERSRNRTTGGTGLGLAIVRSIATRHGGTATLGNGDGGGAIATVRLPLSD